MNSPLTPSALGVMCPLALWRLIGVAYHNCPPCNLLRSLFRLVREVPGYLMASCVGKIVTDCLVCVDTNALIYLDSNCFEAVVGKDDYILLS